MFSQALTGEPRWERKAHVHGILGSVPAWPDAISSLRDKGTWTFYVSISWLGKLGTRGGGMGGRDGHSPPDGRLLRNTNNEGFLRAWSLGNLRPVLQSLLAKRWPRGRGTACRSVVTHIRGCRRCLVQLHVIWDIWSCGLLSGVSLKDAHF